MTTDKSNRKHSMVIVRGLDDVIKDFRTIQSIALIFKWL